MKRKVQTKSKLRRLAAATAVICAVGSASASGVGMAAASVRSPNPRVIDPGTSASSTSTSSAWQPRSPTAKPASFDRKAGESDRGIDVKLAEGARVRLRGGRFSSEAGDNLTGVEGVLRRHPSTRVDRLFSRPEAELAAEKADLERRSHRQQGDLNLYYRLTVEPAESEALLRELNGLDLVEAAYRTPLAQPTPATPDYEPRQGYRQAVPAGIGATNLSAVGGKGENVQIADVEYSWNDSHEDLLKASPPSLIANGTPSDPFNDTNHGTAVLGELVGDSNALGVTGIAPAAGLKRVNAYNVKDGWNPANAIDLARAALSPGDVILVEQQTTGPNGGFAPLEWDAAAYDAIVRATSAGIHVVEAAGNGNQNLDASEYGATFPRGKVDSGAIIVGAGGAPGCTNPARGRLGFSNYGKRVNLQGWGECVTTTGYGDLSNAAYDQRYTANFNGTSSASPIVAGAAALVSSVAEARGTVLTPVQLRALLVATGTGQDTSVDARHIGPLPNVVEAVTTNSTGLLYEKDPSSVSWGSRTSLTYAFFPGLGTADIPNDDERLGVTQAFNVWSRVSGLRFTDVTNSPSVRPDISVWWGNFHNGGADYLVWGGAKGSIGFDDNEEWTLSPQSSFALPAKIDLVTAAIHAIGHQIGLSNSSRPESYVMPARYVGTRRLPKADDIAAVQALYGGTQLVPQHNSNGCLDVWLASTAHGANVVQGSCNGGGNQQWKLVRVGGGYFEVRPKHSLSSCLDVWLASTADGADVRQGDCNGGANQRWRLVATGNGYFELRAQHSNKCVDVAGASMAHGAEVQQWSCNGNPQQKWRFG